MTRKKLAAFSLIEVVLAVAIMALAVTVVLALLPTLLRQGQGSFESQVAAGLPDAVRIELKRLAAAGFDSLAARIPEAGTSDEGLRIVAPRDGERVQSLNYLVPTSERIFEADQYFLVECWRLSEEPFRFSANKACLALEVCVSWPWRIPDATAPSEARHRNRVWFVVSVNR